MQTRAQHISCREGGPWFSGLPPGPSCDAVHVLVGGGVRSCVSTGPDLLTEQWRKMLRCALFIFIGWLMFEKREVVIQSSADTSHRSTSHPNMISKDETHTGTELQLVSASLGTSISTEDTLKCKIQHYNTIILWKVWVEMLWFWIYTKYLLKIYCRLVCVSVLLCSTYYHHHMRVHYVPRHKVSLEINILQFAPYYRHVRLETYRKGDNSVTFLNHRFKKPSGKF